ncbi:deoxycytidine kinase-like [Mercenaria mercenaria]|uniref:deoxycytidine kinase-like n=1 Tax=Mercenaria mercenaria TaxID=6596 RepID=UPI00234F5B29|nr:deoxycytidine kinase-like [Mercenaria mercenaria]
MSTKIHVFAVEGNIGAGKTTFIDLLRMKYPVFGYYYETLQEWQNVKSTDGSDINVFEKASRKPNKYGFPFQMITLTSQLNILTSLPTAGHQVVIVERSYLSNRNVFARALRDKRKINDTEWACYDFMLNKLLPKNFEYSGFIYLNTSPQKCFERMYLRNRREERNVSFKYIRRLHDYHNEWLMNRNDVLVLDNDNYKTCAKDYSSMLDEVQKFISMTVRDEEISRGIVECTKCVEIGHESENCLQQSRRKDKSTSYDDIPETID